ncbi:MAG TPA: hypothetical protein VMO80_00345 [Terriglobales bacterium]|jgi:hypothetical protein|nr:hypothetical protein [Terriglobales bacterium]
MINENALRDALLALVEHEKSTYLMASSLVAELAALRETVRGLDPTFAEVLEQKRLAVAQENAPLERSVIRTYDEILHRLKSGEVC